MTTGVSPASFYSDLGFRSRHWVQEMIIATVNNRTDCQYGGCRGCGKENGDLGIHHGENGGEHRKLFKTGLDSGL